MSFSQGAFLLFSIITLGAAVQVVVSRRIFHGALWLIVSFFGIAAIYLFLESPFMAGIQLFIYIGGVAVLTVIAIMVTKGIMREDRSTLNAPWAAGIVSVTLFGVMVWMIQQLSLPTEPTCCLVEDGLELLGAAFVDPTGYLLPFEVVSVMMLVVLMGALYLGRER